jgi:Domain of unknown function (DUF4365)
MTEPASYPANDAPEHASIALFEYSIDPHIIKTDIKKRDKSPNVDGFIEIVKNTGGREIPIGKLEVQIKTLPSGKLKYSCPSSLVGYSEITTLPVLLICVDSDSKNIFWKHIKRLMPEYKEDQQTFTVVFDPTVDSIDSTNTYVRRWSEIVSEYRQRITLFPQLQREVVEKFGLANVNPGDIRYFQEFIDRLNGMLDNTFPILKTRCLGDAWKLGVGILDSAGMGVAYQLYRIPYGANAPLVISLANHTFAEIFHLVTAPELNSEPPLAPKGCDTINILAYSTREDPQVAADKVVFDFLDKSLSAKALRISGYYLSVEVLFDFLYRYAHTIGLDEADSYDVAQLNYGFKVFLPAWYKLALERYLNENEAILKLTGVFPKFENIAGMLPRELRPTVEETRAFIAANVEPFSIPLNPLFFSTASLFEAVEFLVEEKIPKISRLYPKRALVGGWIWNGYSAEDFEVLIKAVLENLFTCYDEFLKANKIKLQKSKYLDVNYSYVFYADCKAWASDGSKHPFISYFHIENVERKLPYVIIINGAAPQPDTKLLIGGDEHKVVRYGWTGASELFQPLPLLNSIYGMLVSDLNHEYGTRLNASVRGLVF